MQMPNKMSLLNDIALYMMQGLGRLLFNFEQQEDATIELNVQNRNGFMHSCVGVFMSCVVVQGCVCVCLLCVSACKCMLVQM